MILAVDIGTPEKCILASFNQLHDKIDSGGNQNDIPEHCDGSPIIDPTLLSTPICIQRTLSQSESGAFLVDSTPIHSSVLLPVPSWRRSTLPTIDWEWCLSSPSPTHKWTYDEMQDDIEMLKYDKQ